MQLHPGINQQKLLRALVISFTFTLALGATAILPAQTPESKSSDDSSSESKPTHPKPDTYETFYLANSPQPNDLNDAQTLLRNMLPYARIYAVPSQHAIVVYSTKEEIATAHKLLADIDKKKSVYRLTYTMTEASGDKRIYSFVATSGEKATLKLGNKVPIVTGKSDANSANADTQVQYIDLGLSIDATLDTAAETLRLRTKVEQSSLSDEKSILGSQDPIIRQATLESNATLVPGKSLTLGSLAQPGSSHPVEVEVIAELVK